jgi:hypothetical protein
MPRRRERLRNAGPAASLDHALGEVRVIEHYMNEE